MGRPKTRLVVAPSERGALQRWSRRPKTAQALALAGRVLSRPDLVAAAQREADQLWVRFLLAGEVPYGAVVLWPVPLGETCEEVSGA